MLVIAVLVVPVVLIQESSPDEPLKTIALVGDWVIWIAFAIEAAVMLTVVPNRWAWIRSNPFSLPIVLFTGPFLPGSLAAARVLRVVRLVRLGRSFRLLRRYLSLDGLPFVSILTGFVVLAAGTAFAEVEREQDLAPWDGIWWAMSTITTVGYGDLAPKTDEGRTLAILLMIVGIGFVAMLTAALAQSFVTSQTDEEIGKAGDVVEEQLREMNERLTRIEQALARRG